MNLPQNPKSPGHLPQPNDETPDDTNSTVLSHGADFVRVHKDMVGDYLRAGWNIHVAEPMAVEDSVDNPRSEKQPEDPATVVTE